MIAHALRVYVALEPVDMRFGYERLGWIVRERRGAPDQIAAAKAAGKYLQLVRQLNKSKVLVVWTTSGFARTHEEATALVGTRFAALRTSPPWVAGVVSFGANAWSVAGANGQHHRETPRVTPLWRLRWHSSAGSGRGPLELG